MKFLDKIKSNYHNKFLEDNIKNKNFNEVNSYLQNLLNSNDKFFIKTLKSLNDIYFLNPEYNEFYQDKKYIWISSFDEKDTYFVKNFINFYFTKIGFDDYQIGHFPEFFNNYRSTKNLNGISNEIFFSDFSQNTNFYQTLLFYLCGSKYLVMSSLSSFFETVDDPKKYLINYPSTICYFHIVNNPSNLFKRYKSKNQSSHAASNEIFNYDHQITKNTFSKNNNIFSIEESRQNWNTHTSSWLDPNVYSTYKGKTIVSDDLFDSTDETLSSIIFHLKQHGLSIEVDLELIKSYTQDNPIILEEYPDLSQQEKKFIKRDTSDNLIKYFDFDI